MGPQVQGEECCLLTGSRKGFQGGGLINCRAFEFLFAGSVRIADFQGFIELGLGIFKYKKNELDLSVNFFIVKNRSRPLPFLFIVICATGKTCEPRHAFGRAAPRRNPGCMDPAWLSPTPRHTFDNHVFTPSQNNKIITLYSSSMKPYFEVQKYPHKQLKIQITQFILT